MLVRSQALYSNLKIKKYLRMEERLNEGVEIKSGKHLVLEAVKL